MIPPTAKHPFFSEFTPSFGLADIWTDVTIADRSDGLVLVDR